MNVLDNKYSYFIQLVFVDTFLNVPSFLSIYLPKEMHEKIIYNFCYCDSFSVVKVIFYHFIPIIIPSIHVT